MRVVLASVPLVFVLVAAACDGRDPVSEGADNTAGLETVVAEANAAAETIQEQANESPPAPVTDDEAPELAPPTPGAVIPAQYHGRWGMVPGDCTSTRGDAKGLITIGDTRIRFYESTATVMEQRPAKATSFSALFAFTGEGQRWEKVMTLTRSGNALERAEPEGRYTYRRCA